MQAAGNLSILFDVGGVAGGALAGALSDKCGAAASVSAGLVFASLPAMFLYRAYGHLSLGWNLFLMATAGCFVNGPYALITTAVSADLGNHSSVAGAAPCTSYFLCVMRICMSQEVADSEFALQCNVPDLAQVQS